MDYISKPGTKTCVTAVSGRCCFSSGRSTCQVSTGIRDSVITLGCLQQCLAAPRWYACAWCDLSTSLMSVILSTTWAPVASQSSSLRPGHQNQNSHLSATCAPTSQQSFFVPLVQVRFQLEQGREGLQRQLAATDGHMHILQANMQDAEAEQKVHCLIKLL